MNLLKEDDPDKIIDTDFFESIINGVNSPVEVNNKDSKIYVAEAQTKILLSESMPFKVYFPFEEIIIIFPLFFWFHLISFEMNPFKMAYFFHFLLFFF